VNTERLDLASFLAEDPTRRVQDPASAEPVAATSGLRPKLIVDFCAGRGTKTRQLAETHPDAEILATDVDRARYEDLRRVFAGHPKVRVVTPDDMREAIGRADLLVLDVPCSNTGVLPRRPEARYRFDTNTLKDIATLQRRIIRETEPFLAPGGTILFATCSLEPLENRRMAAWMERRFGMRIRSESQRFPSGVPGDPPTAIHDGSYHALLVREDGAESESGRTRRGR
jgi:16S rRNA (cytosine967-C5)-methyltransferase